MGSITPRRIIIGDVHGHYDGLMRLLDTIAPAQTDQVYFLGDLIDRGPASSQVVSFVQEHGYTSLLGNHEQLMLEAFPAGRTFAPGVQAWLFSGGRTTVASYTDVSLLMDHLEWMKTLPLYLDLGDVWLVHAGLDPKRPIESQTAQEFCWIRESFHRSTEPYFSNKLIITGHTITFTLPHVMPGDLASGPGWLDIDTGAYHPKSGWLTGLDISNSQVYQVNVFSQATRSLPLEEAICQVEFSKSHRQHIFYP